MGNLSGRKVRKKDDFCDVEEFEEEGERPHFSNPMDVNMPKISGDLSEDQVFNICSTDRINEFQNYGILPLNTLHRIFQYSSNGDVFNVMQSCKLCFHICNTNLFWRERFRYFCDATAEKVDDENKIVNWKKAFYDQFLSFKRINDIYKKIMYFNKEEQVSNKFNLLVRILLIGDLSVGKSSLLLRYSEDKFDENPIASIGVDFKIRTIRAGEKIVKLQIWDTAGQERFRTITNSYYKGSHVILLCFALDDEKSFQSIDQWYEDIMAYTDEKVGVVVVGTKSDCSRKVSRKDVEKKMKKLCECFDMRYQYCECSAKENDCCVLPFGLGMRAFFNNYFVVGRKEERNTIL